MSQIFKEKDKEEEDTFDAGFKIPDTKSTIAALKQALRTEHQQLTEEEEKQGKGQKENRRQRQGGAICCCGDTNCRIGPFTERA